MITIPSDIFELEGPPFTWNQADAHTPPSKSPINPSSNLPDSNTTDRPDQREALDLPEGVETLQQQANDPDVEPVL